MATSQDIDVWLVDYAQVNDTALHAAYRRLLPEDERLQETRFHFARDQRRYLVTRALVRLTLSRYASIAPEDWRFTTNRYGRPEIADPAAGAAELSFNVSHTHSLIVLGVTRSRRLGLDVENIHAREAALDMAPRFFAPQEVTTLFGLPSQQQSYRFFEYWTFKESYIKARGMGLSIPLDKFGFRFADRSDVAIDAQPELEDDVARWQFWQFIHAEHYMIAICAERVRSGPAPSVVVRQLVPLMNERVVSAMFLRASEIDRPGSRA
jgi:4'-phosphopantetheinyl transferase